MHDMQLAVCMTLTVCMHASDVGGKKEERETDRHGIKIRKTYLDTDRYA